MNENWEIIDLWWSSVLYIYLLISLKTSSVNCVENIDFRHSLKIDENCIQLELMKMGTIYLFPLKLVEPSSIATDFDTARTWRDVWLSGNPTTAHKNPHISDVSPTRDRCGSGNAMRFEDSGVCWDTHHWFITILPRVYKIITPRGSQVDKCVSKIIHSPPVT